MPASALNKSLRTALASEIRLAREAAGLTQEELAFRCGVHRTYVSQVERGLKSPTVDTLELLAPALKVPISGLLKRAEALAREQG